MSGQDPERHEHSAGPDQDPGRPAAEAAADSFNPSAESVQSPAEGMGVSSERIGPTGPGPDATHGTRDTREGVVDPGPDAPPEQSTGGPEENPAGIPPKAGYSSKDPRDDDEV